jgi:hypothetical protein
MSYRSSTAAAALVGARCATAGDSGAWDDAPYPDFSGQWRPIDGPERLDISKPRGGGQQAPLTPEYQAIFEGNLKAEATGRQGTTKIYRCFSPAMARVTNGYGEIEFVVTPKTTHILVDHICDNRRSFTDARPGPAEITPILLGYSIGQRIDGDDVAEARRAPCEARVLRRQRACAACRQPHHRHGTDLHRQKRSRHCSGRGHGDRPRADASVDRHEELPARCRSLSDLERGQLRRDQQSCHHRTTC